VRRGERGRGRGGRNRGDDDRHFKSKDDLYKVKRKVNRNRGERRPSGKNEETVKKKWFNQFDSKEEPKNEKKEEEKKK